LGEEFGGPGVDLFAFVLEFFDLVAGILDFGFGLFLAANERGHLSAALFDELGQFGEPLFQRLLLLAEGGAHLFFGGEADLALGEAGVGGIAVLAEGFQLGR